MTTTQETATATVTQARENMSDLLDATEHHGQTIVITRSGTPAGKLCPPDAGRMPDPELWQAAREAYDKAITTGLVGAPRVIVTVLAKFGSLLAAHYDYDQKPAVEVCGLCGATITATASGTYWVDGEGWDHCDGTSDSHEPAKGAAENV